MKYLSILIIAGIILVAATLIISLYFFDGPAAEKPYEKSLTYDQTGAAIKRAGLRLDIVSVSSKGGETRLVYTLSGKPGASFKPLEPRIQRPATSRSSVILTGHAVLPDTPGIPRRFELRFKTEDRGWFILVLSIRLDERVVELQKSFFVRENLRKKQ
jgi:hypothetical protein